MSVLRVVTRAQCCHSVLLHVTGVFGVRPAHRVHLCFLTFLTGKTVGLLFRPSVCQSVNESIIDQCIHQSRMNEREQGVTFWPPPPGPRSPRVPDSVALATGEPPEETAGKLVLSVVWGQACPFPPAHRRTAVSPAPGNPSSLPRPSGMETPRATLPGWGAHDPPVFVCFVSPATWSIGQRSPHTCGAAMCYLPGAQDRCAPLASAQ